MGSGSNPLTISTFTRSSDMVDLTKSKTYKKTPKMKLLSFTHPHIIPNTHIQRHFWKTMGYKQLAFHCMDTHILFCVPLKEAVFQSNIIVIFGRTILLFSFLFRVTHVKLVEKCEEQKLIVHLTLAGTNCASRLTEWVIAVASAWPLTSCNVWAEWMRKLTKASAYDGITLICKRKRNIQNSIHAATRWS